ncbi:MAG: hypothetical protein COA79_09535 [Planctomycetota bacterium]|nr:MAG: hypothetical protein COA79_09535 [Planctomycetota bacterium]
MKYEDIHLELNVGGKFWLFEKIDHTMIEGHVHRELEVNIILSGQADYIVKGQKISLEKKSLIWLFPNQKHLLINITDDFSMIIGVFKSDFLKKLIDKDAKKNLLELDYQDNVPGIITSKQLNSIIFNYEELTEANYGPDYFNTYLSHVCLKLWYLFLDTKNRSVFNELPEVIERCLYLLEDEFNSMTLESIGQDLGYSASQVSRLFKKHIGTSIVEYRQKKRLDYFVSQVQSIRNKNKKINMTNLAFESGFGSYAQFHRIFKSAFGCGPNEYFKT